MDHHQRVVVTGIKLEFWETVNLLTIVAIAAIPALTIVSLFLAGVGMLVMVLMSYVM